MQAPHTTVIVPPAAAPAAGGCSCSVPANTSSHVKGARGAAIAIIVTHAVAIFAVGWWSWALWMSALIAWIMGGIQLCMFQKCTYITAGSLYIVGFILDIVTMAWWIAIADAVNNSTNDEWDGYEHLGWFALPSALAAISMLIGAIYSFLAVCNWHLSGAPDAVGMPAAGGAQVVPPSHTVQMTHQKAQPPPPAYSGTV